MVPIWMHYKRGKKLRVTTCITPSTSLKMATVSPVIPDTWCWYHLSLCSEWYIYIYTAHCLHQRSSVSPSHLCYCAYFKFSVFQTSICRIINKRHQSVLIPDRLDNQYIASWGLCLPPPNPNIWQRGSEVETDDDDYDDEVAFHSERLHPQDLWHHTQHIGPQLWVGPSCWSRSVGWSRTIRSIGAPNSWWVLVS